MCGIVGIVGKYDVVSKILSGLKRLEYRGYDSAGIAIPHFQTKGSHGHFDILKEQGKIAALENLVKETTEKNLFSSHIAIGHTRWATHGAATKDNAHPHATAKFCVVHNGIIENFLEIKNRLEKKGARFLSQTDTEVIPHLIEYYLEKTHDIKDAIIAATNEIRGTYALAIIFSDDKDSIIVAKRGSPILVGFGDNENYVASDYYAISSYTNKIAYLDDNEFAIINKHSVEIFDVNKKKIEKKIKTTKLTEQHLGKGEFDHFMLKEIFEQPRVIEDTIQTYVDLSSSSIFLPNFAFDLRKINKVTIIACGTSFYAGSLAKYLFEEIANVEVEVDIASEFRYRKPKFRDDNLMIFISQSGETADTLAALKFAKENKQKIISIVNAEQSSMAHLSDSLIRTVAGPEIGVASTKAYTAQLAVLMLFIIELAYIKGEISNEKKLQLIQEINISSRLISEVLTKDSVQKIRKVAKSLSKAKDILYIGRGVSYISALEASLKLRELSYINAQGIAAGELKHGTIALVDKKMPVIVLAAQEKFSENLFEKTISNAFEVAARGGKISLISDKNSAKKQKKLFKNHVEIPEISGVIQEALVPIVATQLLAYFVALFKGNDVDQPRNLAKSVTVE